MCSILSWCNQPTNQRCAFIFVRNTVRSFTLNVATFFAVVVASSFQHSSGLDWNHADEPENVFSVATWRKKRKKKHVYQDNSSCFCVPKKKKNIDGLAPWQDLFVSVFAKPVLLLSYFQSGAPITDCWCLNHCVRLIIDQLFLSNTWGLHKAKKLSWILQ